MRPRTTHRNDVSSAPSPGARVPKPSSPAGGDNTSRPSSQFDSPALANALQHSEGSVHALVRFCIRQRMLAFGTKKIRPCFHLLGVPFGGKLPGRRLAAAIERELLEVFAFGNESTREDAEGLLRESGVAFSRVDDLRARSICELDLRSDGIRERLAAGGRPHGLRGDALWFA